VLFGVVALAVTRPQATAPPPCPLPTGQVPSTRQAWFCNGETLTNLPLRGPHNAAICCWPGGGDHWAFPFGSSGDPEPVLQAGRSGALHIAGITLLDETYNASPEAVWPPLHLLAGQEDALRVLGTNARTRRPQPRLHQEIGGWPPNGPRWPWCRRDGDDGRGMERGAAQPSQARFGWPRPKQASTRCCNGFSPTGDQTVGSRPAGRGPWMRLIPLLEPTFPHVTAPRPQGTGSRL